MILFGVLRDVIRGVEACGKVMPNGCIGRFKYASSKVVKNDLSRLSDSPGALFEKLHKVCLSAGFIAATAETRDISNALDYGVMSCEQLCFLYLAMLNRAGLDVFGSRANENLRVVTMFNPSDTHIVIAPVKTHAWVWETTVRRGNQKHLSAYHDFDYLHSHDVRTFMSVVTKLFCLDP